MCGMIYGVNAKTLVRDVHTQHERDKRERRMATKSPAVTTSSSLRVASGRIVKKYQKLRARPSLLVHFTALLFVVLSIASLLATSYSSGSASDCCISRADSQATWLNVCKISCAPSRLS